MNDNSCSNNFLWLLLAALALSGGNFRWNNVLQGCGLPFLIALLYCTGRNGSLADAINNLFGNNNCG
ncbi:MAG: hypothetical protein J6Z36_01055 [Clostridia bacterium]|nr:hypothetical protein [Clostridia bacterium]